MYGGRGEGPQQRGIQIIIMPITMIMIIMQIVTMIITISMVVIKAMTCRRLGRASGIDGNRPLSSAATHRDKMEEIDEEGYTP